MINFTVWLIAGACIGWIASVIMRTMAQQGVLLNMLLGMAGALIAGLAMMTIFGIGPIGQANFSLPALLVALVGAILLLAVVDVSRRSRLLRQR